MISVGTELSKIQSTRKSRLRLKLSTLDSYTFLGRFVV